MFHSPDGTTVTIYVLQYNQTTHPPTCNSKQMGSFWTHLTTPFHPRPSAMTPTSGVDEEVKHGGVGATGYLGQVERDDLGVVPEPLLHLGAVVQLQEGSDGPHEGEDEQPLVMLPLEGGRILLILRDQTLQQVAALSHTRQVNVRLSQVKCLFYCYITYT